MEIETWPVNKPVPYAGNARKIPEAAVAKVAVSIQEYGWRQPIVVDEQGVIVAGHTRLLAAQQLGLRDVPVHVARGLTAAQVKAYRLMDNRSHQEAKWDVELLPIELADLKAIEFDMSLTGFDEAELERLLGPEAGLTDADAAPPVPELATTQAADLWLMGEHRLLCGDATSDGDVRRLFCGNLADLVFTDPPYGVDYDGGTVVREKLAGDTSTSLYGPACRMAFEFSKLGAALYLWHAGVKGIAAAAAAAAAGYQIRCEIVWNKQLAQFGSLSAQYKQKHEPCYYCFKRGHAPGWYGPTNEVTVWDCDRAAKNDFHPTQKPVAIAERALRNSSKAGDTVLDCFLGSGTTLIAAEQLNRVCYGLEIEPKYCDVIVQRWQNFTGKEATLDGDGRTFAEIKAERFGIRLGAQDAIAEEVLRS